MPKIYFAIWFLLYPDAINTYEFRYTLSLLSLKTTNTGIVCWKSILLKEIMWLFKLIQVHAFKTDVYIRYAITNHANVNITLE